MRLIALLFVLPALIFGQPKTTSQEIVLKSVVEALVAKDATALKALSISKEEFKKYVWPHIPGNGMSAEKFFSQYERSSQVGIDQGILQFGGKSVEVVSVTPGTVQKKVKDYTLFLSPVVVVREGGQEKMFHPVGGVLERGGVFKVTTYYTRGPK